MTEKYIKFQAEPIDPKLYMGETPPATDGAVVTFTGCPRNHSRGKTVLYLEYEIYESMAEKEMEKIADSAINRWDINSCVIIHRYKKVNIGEISIFILVSSPHRDDAYTASRFIIDSIKKSVPVWKKEYYSDGSNWVTDRI